MMPRLDPDMMLKQAAFNKDIVTFTYVIYTDEKDGGRGGSNLFTCPGKYIHEHLKDDWQDDETDAVVTGRLGTYTFDDGEGDEANVKVVCLWPAVIPDERVDPREAYDRCLYKLKKDGLVTGSDWFVCVAGARPELLSRSTLQPGDDADLRRKLHTADYTTKRYIRAALNMKGGSKKNQWQGTLEKAGALHPGQKWWAPHSESSFNLKLDRALSEMVMPRHTADYS